MTQETLPRDRRVAIGVFFLALAVYMVTYVGAFKSNDERALFSGIDSFIKRGEFTVNQIYWDYTNVGMLTSAGDMVPNYEPGQMVAAIPFYLWGRALGAAVQGTMFFNVLVTAASAALVYLCFLELRYRRRTSTLGALVFAFATLAWPYSRTFFREPLTVLAYLVAVYALLRYRPPEPRRLRWPFVAGLALGVALATKQISIAFVPTFLVLVYAYERGRPADPDKHLTRQRLAMAAAALVPLLLVLGLERVYHVATLGGVELFARNIVEYTTNPQLSQSAPARMMRALLGLSVSPYKGLFWYAPVLLLGLIGAVPFTRRFRWEGLAFLLLIGGHFLGYSRYNYWSGGVAWGSRYMLPVIPFLVLLAGPVFAWLMLEPLAGTVGDRPEPKPVAGTVGDRPEQGITVTHYALRVTVWLLIALSVFVQVLGVSVDLRTYELRFLLDNAEIWGGIGQAIEALYLQPGYSPVIGHLRLLLSGTQPLDFAWVQLRELGTWAFLPAGLLVSLAFLAVAIVAFVVIWRRPQRAGWIGLGMTVLAVTAASLLLGIYRQGDGRFDPYGVDRFLRPMMERLEAVDCGWQGCDDVLLVPDPSLTDYFLNYLKAPLVWYATEPDPPDEALLERLPNHYEHIWLARDRDAASDDAEGRRAVEHYLAEHAFKLDEERFGDWARLLRYSAGSTVAEQVAPEQPLGDMTLVEATIGVQPASTSSSDAAQPLDDGVVLARPGETLQIRLRWQADQPPAGNYTVFTQLLDANSQVVAQRTAGRATGFFRPPACTRGPDNHRQSGVGTAGRPASRRLSPDHRPLPRRFGRHAAADRPRRRFRRVATDPGVAMKGEQLPVTSDQSSVISDQSSVTDRRSLLLCLGLTLLLVLPALLPLLRAGFFVSDDGLFHVYRTAALARAWGDGVLWPRLFPEFGFGYGQAVLNFYAPLSYGPAAALTVAGIDPAGAVKIMIAFSTLAAALAAFGYGRHLFGSAAGVLAALVYTYAPYHLADAYLRGAVPEHAAFVFPPLILWAYSAAFRRDNPWPPLLWGTLAWAGLVLTHNLTALMMAPVAVTQLLVLAGTSHRWRRLAGAAGSVALAAAITAVFWLPALAESRSVGLALGPSRGYAEHLLNGATVLRRSLAYFVNAPDTLGRIYPLSWLALALAALGAALLAVRWRQRQLPPGWPAAAFHLGLAVVAMFMTTALALPLWDALLPALGQLQYPWRLLLLEAVGLMGIAAALPALLPRIRPAILIAAVAALSMLVALPGLRVEPLRLSPVEQWLPDHMWQGDAAAGQVGATWTGEFLPLTVGEQRWALGRPREGALDGPPLQPAPSVVLSRLGYDQVTAEVSSAAPWALRLHQFLLPGWNAAVDGAPAATYPSGELGLVTVDLPAGQHTVHVEFGNTPARQAGAIISLLGVVAWIILVWGRGRGRGLRFTSLMLGIMALALALNSFGAGQRAWTPRPVQATLEDMAVLVAADARARPELGVADVTLYWLALRETGQDYKAFVHLLGADGGVIAQHDGDPVGGFTPTTRWRPGEIIADRHIITLPPDLPSGAYGLRAGLYQVDPLRNLRVDPPAPDDRVDVGTVEITP
ncbi:MAG: 6-pyruvoyl-tetrahydropterin synthase-related protein [Caldilineales bacterium]